MRSLMLVVLVALVLLVPRAAAAETPGGVSEADRAAIRAIIGQQLQAFRRDDGAAAFAFASPAIQAMFRTPERFMAMVRTGYLPVYRPREVEFRDVVAFQGQPTQRVLLVGPDNVPVVAYYMMQRQPAGSWRINGCVLMGAEDLGA
jgi:hypothetical protein